MLVSIALYFDLQSESILDPRANPTVALSVMKGMFGRMIQLIAGLGLTCIGVACQSARPPCGACDGYYALSVNGNGQALVDDPAKGRAVPATQAQYEAELKKMERGIIDSGKRRIMVFVHGGLIGLGKSSRESRDIAQFIEKHDLDIYPVFINWDTALVSSYGRHLLHDDAGISYETSAITSAGRWIFFPLNLAGDLGMGISRLPVNAARASSRLSGRSRVLAELQPDAYPEKYSFAKKLDQQLGVRYWNYRGVEPAPEQFGEGFHEVYASRPHFPFHIGLGKDLVALLSERDLMGVLWSPSKNGTLFLAEGVGRGAWDNMVRRARLITHPRRAFFESLPNTRSKQELPQEGPGLVLVRALNTIAKKRGLDLELYGHSMGAMVLNRIIDQLARPGRERELRIKRLVYMGAACRISDFRHTAGRYVQKTKTPFYNLCLHPTQEVRESFYNDAGSPWIAGSLLTWIDSMFERPPSFGDRTLGSFENCVLAESLLPKGPHVHLKGFGADFRPINQGGFFNRDRHSDLGPQKHGEFNNYQFWTNDFLNPRVGNGFQRFRLPD